MPLLQILEGFPILLSDPVITFGHETDGNGRCAKKRMTIHCNIQHGEKTDIFLDVYWHIGGRLVKSNVGENAIAYDDLPAVLHEADWVDQDPGAQGQLDTEVRAG